MYSDFGVALKLISPSLTHTQNNLKLQLTGGKLVGYLQSVVDMTRGSRKTNPDMQWSEWYLNQGRSHAVRFEPGTCAAWLA